MEQNSKNKFLFIDVETNGLPLNYNKPYTDIDNWPRIVQIAWIICDDSKEVITEKCFIIRPINFDIPDNVVKVHGISKQIALTKGLPIEVVLKLLEEESKDCTHFVAHNIAFDAPVIKAEFLRANIAFSLNNKTEVCTMLSSIEYCGFAGNKYPKLEELYFKLFNKKPENLHDALQDIRYTKDCFFKLKEIDIISIKSNNNFNQNTNTEQLQETIINESVNIDIDNPEFQLAFNAIKYTNESLFITGRAGTGKSTFLKYVKQNIEKQMIVLAPTGIAAVNIGGVTINSFFSLPPRILLLEDEEITSFPNGRNKKNLLENADLIIIDEVSMVRPDLIDAIDCSLRRNGYNPDLPFGGKQMIFIGDVFQLEPVIKNEDVNILKETYSDYNFYNAKVFNDFKYATVEFKKVYRQDSDIEYLNLLDKIRLGVFTEKDIDRLNRRLITQKQYENMNLALTVTTHNAVANTINTDKLNKINNKEYEYTANITDDFPPGKYPTERNIRLKVGAQVIFIKNDANKKWYNGTIAKVAKLSDNNIEVEFEDGSIDKIETSTWYNIEYKYNKSIKKIEENVIGSFVQYPIKLAWAITIHKSQGMTFDNLVVDFTLGSFASGQAYVALSRVKSYNGLSMLSKIKAEDVIVSESNIRFSKKNNHEFEINNLKKSIYESKSKLLDSSELRKIWWNNLDTKWKNYFKKMSKNGKKLESFIDLDIIKIIKTERVCIDNTGIDNLEPLSYLINLKVLICSKNEIVDLTPISFCNKLEKLFCNNNRIIDISAISRLKKLKNVDLSHNKIIDITPLKGLSELVRLKINFNNIESLNGLANLKMLKNLFINSNKIKDLKPLSGLINLNYLDCSHNEISEIRHLEDLVNLKILYLSSNIITSVDCIKGLKELEVLSISKNKIEDIECLKYLVNLRSFYSSGNKFDKSNNALENIKLKTYH